VRVCSELVTGAIVAWWSTLTVLARSGKAPGASRVGKFDA